MLSAVRVLLLLFQFGFLLFLFLLIAVAKTSKTMLNSSGESGHLCLVPDFRGILTPGYFEPCNFPSVGLIQPIKINKFILKRKRKKNLPASSGDIRDAGSIPGSGRSPG